MTQAQYRAYLKKRGAKTPPQARGAIAAKKMSSAESRYLYGVLGGKGAYEAEQLRITPDNCEKHIYTPDFVSSEDTWCGLPRVVYHEVKGSYRLQSQDGARLRWCFAALANPYAVFVWAKETPAKRWDIEVWYDGGRTRIKERNVLGFSFGEKGGVLWRR